MMTKKSFVQELRNGLDSPIPDIWDKIKDVPLPARCYETSQVKVPRHRLVYAAIAVILVSATVLGYQMMNGFRHLTPVDVHLPIIAAVDRYDGFSDAALTNENPDSAARISPLLQEKMREFGAQANYKVIIKGSFVCGSEFVDFKSNGKTYSEYSALYDGVLSALKNAVSEEEISSASELANEYLSSMETLIAEYEVVYHNKYSSVNDYIGQHYSMVESWNPVDFDAISKEDYQSLAVVSQATILSLAQDRFYIYLAPEQAQQPVTTPSSDIGSDSTPDNAANEILQRYSGKMSARVQRDIFTNKPINVSVEIFSKDIETFNEETAGKLGVDLQTIMAADGLSGEFLSLRFSLYQAYKQSEYLELTQKYGVTITDSNSSYFCCDTTIDQLLEMVVDEKVFFISNTIESQQELTDN